MFFYYGIIIFLVLFIFLGIRSKKYKERVAKIKPESPSITIISAVLAAPLAFLIYAVAVEITGLLEIFKPESPFGLLILFGFFFVFFTVWRLVALVIKLLIK